MRLLVFGGRDYGFTIQQTKRHPVIRLKPAEIRELFQALDADHRCEPISAVIIIGCAPGADTLGGIWAASRGIPIEEFPADWDRYGMAAGPRRNLHMYKQGRPDAGRRFGGGVGSQNMHDILTKAGIRVFSF